MKRDLMLITALGMMAVGLNASAAPGATPVAVANPTTAPAPTTDRPALKWSGDVRLRHERIDTTTVPVQVTGLAQDVQTKYSQQRAAFRLGASVAFDSNFDAEFRVATGTGRNTTYQTLGASSNALRNYALGLDRAFIAWHGLANFSAMAGRTKNPLWTPVASDMIYDYDLNFDGAWASYTMPVQDINLGINGGWSVINKTTTPRKSDWTLAIAQGYAKTKVQDLSLAAGVTYHHYFNTRGQTVPDSVAAGVLDPKGNSFEGAAGAATYKNEYHLLNLGAEAGMTLANIPFTLGVDWVANTEVGDNRMGYLIGLRANKNAKKGDWAAAYDYRRLKKDAVVGAFIDGDTLAATSGQAHRIRGSYSLADNVLASLTAVIGMQGISDGDSGWWQRNKYIADLGITF